ncbi:uncharacterized protein [Clinocottus analis]|uniref:uncharacterized protein isoform X1 n=1 Tax=Clinocottus analis TaxID=304258 RepID=UPI0035C19539
MRKEKTTRTVELEKLDSDTSMIVGEVKKSFPKMRTVKSTEKIRFATFTSANVTTCETSGNKMRLCVNLMPVLAAAKESDEEDEEGKETSHDNTGPSVAKTVEQTLNSLVGLNSEPGPRFVLPPITQSKAAPERCGCQKRKHTLLPPIRTTSSNSTIKGCGDDRLADNMPWRDNPLFSQSRSPEFRLPDISLSSLNALLQTVTQKLRRKRSGGDEGSCRRFQSNRLLEAVSGQRLREKSDIDAVASLGGCRGNTQRIVPSPSSAPKPILTMTKQNLLTSNTSQ